MLKRYLADCMWGLQNTSTPLVEPHLISPGLHNAGATLCLVVPGEGRVPISALVQSRRTPVLCSPVRSPVLSFVPRPSPVSTSRRLLSRFCLSLRHHPLSLLHNTAFFHPHVFFANQGVTPPVAFSVPKQHRAAASAGLFSPLLSDTT